MTQYKRGANFERAAKKKLEELGFFVVRAAGSHGVADLIAFHPEPSSSLRPMLIQCKLTGKLGPKEKERLISICKRYRLHGSMCYKEKQEIQFKDIML